MYVVALSLYLIISGYTRQGGGRITAKIRLRLEATKSQCKNKLFDREKHFKNPLRSSVC